MAGILQIVDDTGAYDVEGVQKFLKTRSIENAGTDYLVVAIMGPQSSGKSTLLNHAFGTGFKEMDALEGRSQTTRGIWLAKSPKIDSPPTLVMDLEGSDGRERGEDDTSFERQSALFALAVADVLVVNMWAKDIGREVGASKPLLKTIFQVNLKLFAPSTRTSSAPKRTVLLFVFRDKTKTPLEKLKETWEGDLNRMWEGMTKPPGFENSSLEDFFLVRYAALSNYEEKFEEFEADVDALRRRFTKPSTAGNDDLENTDGLTVISPHKLPGHALSLSMQKVWELVRENKDLDLPAHRVMVANIRCAEIAAEQLNAFKSDARWQAILTQVEVDLIPSFGERVGELVAEMVGDYEEEARYFDTATSGAREEGLLQDLKHSIRPGYEAQLRLARAVALETFRLALGSGDFGDRTVEINFMSHAQKCINAALSEFDVTAREIEIPGIEWTPFEAREALQHELMAHRTAVRSQLLAEAINDAVHSAQKSVSRAAASLFEAPPKELWRRLTIVWRDSLAIAQQPLEKVTERLDLSPEECLTFTTTVSDAGRSKILSIAKEAADTALPRLKDAFSEAFYRDSAGVPRAWSPSTDVTAIATDAKRTCATLLAQLCISRLPKTPFLTNEDDTESEEEAEAYRSAVSVAVAGLARPVKDFGRSVHPNALPSFDILSASEWPGIGIEDVLMTPPEVRQVWKRFSSDVALTIQQAAATREANRAAARRLPPAWAILAMIVLGFNEAIAVLRNPLLLLALFLFFLFAKTVYQELDVEGEMARGALPGLVSLSSKFVPAIKSVASKTISSIKTVLEGLDDNNGPEQVEGLQLSTMSTDSSGPPLDTVTSSRTVFDKKMN
jgi:hypothetical protein